MSTQLSQVIASRLSMQPVLISPTSGHFVAESLQHLAAADPEREAAAQIKARSDMLSAYGYEGGRNDKPFAFAEGIAFVPVTGLLINRFNASYGWVTGYNFIRSTLLAAMADNDVKNVVLDCSSNGGEVSGCFELAADIVAMRGSKPMLAVVDPNCYSACYAIASAADKIIVTPSGGVGSIGVVAMHVDMSKMLDKMGVKVTFIHSGDHKVDGNPYEPLPAAVQKSIQARVHATRQEFVSLVAPNRGLDSKVVFDTEAACYSAQEALDIGLVDGIATPREAVKSFFVGLSKSSSIKLENQMSTEAKPASAESVASTTETDSAVESKAATTASTETKAAATADGRTAERERIKAIQSHANAEGKPALANHLALNTDMSVDDAAALLAVATPEVTQAANTGISPFTAAMEASGHPNVGAEGGAEGGSEMSAAARILASQALATGTKAH